MGGLWYGLTRICTEPFIGRQASKEQGEKNEKYMRRGIGVGGSGMVVVTYAIE